ncbi:MAG: epoxyqueuosine reductase QueH [Elusimicrobia bacterium]|nr:epoxyqueuosine reductase QueH [Elusimicrobiota bacterium]
MRTVLLHTCCGICGFSAKKYLAEEFNIKYHWYNPNIHFPSEHKRRLEVAIKNFPLIVSEYNWKEWFSKVKSFADRKDKRCSECYMMRMTKTARKAKELKLEYFSTTLLTSPYQNHEELKKTGEQLQNKFGVKFYYYDGRENFYKNTNEFKKLGYYMQKYCGCVFSKYEK